MALFSNPFGRFFAARRTSPEIQSSEDRFIFIGDRLAGVMVTHEEALRLSAVWACVTVIAKSIASCRWDVFLERPNGDREARRDTMAYRLLNERPNPEMTAFSFREAIVIQSLIWGNSYSEIEKDRGGRPVGIWPISPERGELERDRATGRLVCAVSNYDKPETILDYADVFHLHGPGVDGIAGFDVVATAARTLAHASAAQRFGQAFYGNGTQMGGVLSSDKTLTPEQMKDLREQVNAKHQGPDKAFRFLMLGGGMSYQALSVSPDDAQFIETNQHLVEEVCRYFGVPPHKIQHLLRATNNNIEHQGIEFVRDALVPWAERLAQEADFKLLPDWRGIKSRLDLDWLAEGDAKSKAETDSILVQNGLMSRNEARKKRGLNTVGPDGDKLTVQLNMTTLDKIGMDQPQPASRDVAARALFKAAVKRSLSRQTGHAKEVAARVDGAEAFRAEIDGWQANQGQYVGRQIADALAILKCDVPSDKIKAALLPALSEEPDLLSEAYTNGNLDGWCDIDARADEIAAVLAALING